MPNDPLGSVGEVVRSIEQGSQQYRKLATQITDTILLIESRIEGVQGSLASTAVGIPDEAGNRLWLRLDRDGRFVKFYYAVGDALMFGTPDNWKALANAPLRIKIASIELMPELLQNVADEQQREIQRLQSFTESLDQLLEGLDRNSKEGA